MTYFAGRARSKLERKIDEDGHLDAHGQSLDTVSHLPQSRHMLVPVLSIVLAWHLV
jgi:hypothetical protein